MRVKLSSTTIHGFDLDCFINKTVDDDAFRKESMTEEEILGSDMDVCPKCFPDLAS